MTDQTDRLIAEVQSSNKAIEHENIKKQNQKLKRLLAEMCMHADEDTPSEHRTKHFTNTMNTSYDYLYEIGHLKEHKKKITEYYYPKNKDGFMGSENRKTRTRYETDEEQC